MFVDFLMDSFFANVDRSAIVWRDRDFSYGYLLEALGGWRRRLSEENLAPGTTVSLEADFTPNAIALLLALIDRGCVVVPLTTSVNTQKAEFHAIAQIETIIELDLDDQAVFTRTATIATHELLVGLKERRHPGLVLFSSGSTGKNKAALHDFVPLLEKFRVPRHCMRTITFLLFDHIGGINTLFYTLANAGCIVAVEERSPHAVCRAIARHQVELLPTSPTFLNLLLVSESEKASDLASLRMVTYGTEVMPESTLRRFNERYPHVRLLQTYGLSEVGILRSKSKSSDSLWVKIGGEGYETRVVNGLLEIKAQSAMLGYLNAPSPFSSDGWFQTGDAVEVEGEYVRILGRRSEIINVGGEKVYPAEVESTLQLMEGVEDVVVRGEPSALVGHMVTALVKTSTGESLSQFRTRMVEFCRDKLPRYKVPQKVVLTAEDLHGQRFKKKRSAMV